MKKFLLLIAASVGMMANAAAPVFYTIDTRSDVGEIRNVNGDVLNAANYNWFAKWTSTTDASGITVQIAQTMTTGSRLRRADVNKNGIGLGAISTATSEYTLTIPSGLENYYVSGYSYKALAPVEGLQLDGKDVSTTIPTSVTVTGLHDSDFSLTFTTLGSSTSWSRIDLYDFTLILTPKGSLTYEVNADMSLGGKYLNSAGNTIANTLWFANWTSPVDADGISVNVKQNINTTSLNRLRAPDADWRGFAVFAIDNATYSFTLSLPSGESDYYVCGYTYKVKPVPTDPIIFNGEVLPVEGKTVRVDNLPQTASPFTLDFTTEYQTKGSGSKSGRIDLTDFYLFLSPRQGYESDFSFESGMPWQWSVTGADVAFNNDHATKGSNSMMLVIGKGQKAVLDADLEEFTPTSAQAISFDIYATKASNAPVSVEILDAAGNVALSASATLNLKGWQTFHRAYTADFGAASATNLGKLRLSIDNSTADELKVYVDNVNFRAKVGTVPSNTNSDATYTAMPLMAPDADQIKTLGCELLKLYTFEADVDLATPTVDELAGLAKVNSAVGFALDAAPTEADLQTARSFATALGVTRLADGTLKSRAIVSAADGYTAAKEQQVVKYLSWLGASDSADDQALFNDFLAAMMDQNVMYRFPRMRSNTYAPIRLIPRVLIAAAQKCADSHVAQRTIEAARWVAESGWAFAPQSYFASKDFSSDILYLFPNYWLGTAANDAYTPEAVRQLKGVSNLLGKIVVPNDGGYDMVKPDGSCYHHGYHYNNYMYAFKTWIATAKHLAGTPFAISGQALDDCKRAVLAMYAMSNRSDDGKNYFANSLSGRHPFTSGMVNQISPSDLATLVELSGNDPDLAAAYNYYTMSDKYNAAAHDFTGFYQFNFSPIGVYRTDNWTVTMRCPTTRCIGAEIYSSSNRFGRYMSSGSMEILYNGAPANSGLPSEAKGYDWRIVPGATTVHHSSWSDLTPKGNTSQRFDQFSDSDFAGALSMGKCGMFACDFKQNDYYYNAQCFTPTGLSFRKSVMAVDGMLVCVGSAISAPQATDIVASNLFQELGDDLGAVLVNGAALNNGDADLTADCSTSDSWVLSPLGTGYYIPAGNAATLNVKYGIQQGPNETGSDIASPATAIAARAYLNHGKGAVNQAYTYVAVPGATAEQMASMADNFADNFEMLSTQGQVHGIHYVPADITALAFFEATDTGCGIVKSVGSGMVVMYRKNADGSVDVHVCVPNLNPVKEGSYVEQWATRPIDTHITFEGSWKIPATPTVKAIATKARTADAHSTIALTMSQGETTNFTLTADPDVSIDQVEGDNMTGSAEAVYTLQGIRVDSAAALAPGIYIVKTGQCVKKIRIN